MKSDGLFFLGVIGFFFVLWFTTGGPTRPISFAGPYITPITDVDTVQYGYGDGSAITAGNGESSGQSIWANIMGIEGRLADLQRDSSEIRAFGDASPYRGQVTVSSDGTGATDPDQEYVRLRASGTQSVDITGWRLISGASGRGARIPEGASLPRSGRVNDTGRIVLAPGEDAIVVTGDAPSGVSFKENLCTGYLAKNQAFYPSLANQCPAPYDEFDRFFTGNELRDDKCYERVQATPSCVTPDDDGVSSACERLIDGYLTYNGCVEKHRYDSNFKGSTWRIYLDYDNDRRDKEGLWKSTRDSIKLVDTEGKTVDLYTY